MNKEEILNKYIDLIDKGYCCACNELNCIDNFPHEKITHAIRELQQENKQLKEKIDKANEFIRKHTKIIPFDEFGEGGGLELVDYDIADLLKILGDKENEEKEVKENEN